MKLWPWLLIGGIIVVLSFVGFKTALLSPNVAFILFFISLAVMTILTIIYGYKKFASDTDFDKTALPQKGPTVDNATDDYVWSSMREINRQLKSRPGGDYIEWSGGIDVRTKMKRFLNPATKKTEDYLAVQGILNLRKRRILVIYNLQKKTIDEFYGDPPPALLANPFLNFRPVETMGSSGGEGYPPPYGSYPRFDKRWRDRRGINISFPEGEQQEQDVGQYFEDIDLSKYK